MKENTYAPSNKEMRKDMKIDDRLFKPTFVKPAFMKSIGYVDAKHPDGSLKGYYKYKSEGILAMHREGRKHQQILWGGKRVIYFNCGYCPEDKAVYCLIKEDGDTRTIFNGVIENAEQLKLILRLAE
jgi:hypothetical protein